MISAKFVPLKYYTLSSQLRRLTSFSVGCSGWRILSPGQIAVMRKWSISQLIKAMAIENFPSLCGSSDDIMDDRLKLSKIFKIQIFIFIF